MAKLSIQEFVDKFYKDANEIAAKHGIPALVMLTQAAIESGWGEHAPKYNFFGITANDKYKGSKQLLRTTEYHKTNTVKYPVIISIVLMTSGTYKGLYKYIVKRYFRAYNKAEECFEDYAAVLKNDRYKEAFKYTDKPEQFITEIAKAGYATNTQYLDLALAVMKSIKKRVS